MLVIFGYLVVIATVFGGFVLSGGNLLALFQPLELLIIGGAGVGAFIVGNNMKSLKATGKAIVKLFVGKRYNKTVYMDLMALMFLLLSKSRVQGLMSLEKDIEDPAGSEIFSAYPRLMSDPMLSNFILDYFRLMIGGSMNSHEIEALMDEEIETCEEELEVPAHSLNTVGDAFPAFGIVAAVMGVVNALGAADRPAAEPRNADWPRAGGHVPRNFDCLRVCITARNPAASDEFRSGQNPSVYKSHAALQSKRLCATNCRGVWPKNHFYQRTAFL